MPLDLYMIGVMTADMGKSLEFYQRLGLAIPEGSDGKTHVEVKLESGLTFFLDSNPARFDPGFVHAPKQPDTTHSYPFLLEFYLKERSIVDAKYKELTDFGYPTRAPYQTVFGMYFAWVTDPDGNTILLSAD